MHNSTENLGVHQVIGTASKETGLIVSHLLWHSLIFYSVLARLGSAPVTTNRSIPITPSAEKKR